MRILLTRLSALGDIVHTWPLAEAAAAAGHQLAWVVEEPFAPLVATHPAVARTVVVATKRWRRRPASPNTRDEIRAALTAISSFAPEAALDPQGLWKSAAWAALAGVPRRVGLARAARRERLCGLLYTEVVEPPRGAHVVDVNLSLLSALAATVPVGARPDGSFLVAGNASPGWLAPGTVSLLPATGGRGKAWSPHAYAHLAERLRRAGHRVVIIWGPREENLARSIAAAAGRGVDVAPPTSLAELATALSHSTVVVGGDTGPVHLAAALGTATVAVMVATDPRRNAPRGRRVTVLNGAVGTARRGRARTARGADVSVDEVERAVLAELSPPPAGHATIGT